jgi:hypothetical protein
LNESVANFDNFPSDVGIVPVFKFPFIWRRVKRVKSPSDVGKLPDTDDAVITRIDRDDSCPIDDEIVPSVTRFDKYIDVTL